LLDRIHTHLLPRTYLEIGVSTGASLAIALPGTQALGIDPAPHVQYPLDRSVKLFLRTSDDFFAHHDVYEELGQLPVDLAFIDGLHLFEFALRDFMNVERWSTPESTILIHDCYPIDVVSSQREPSADLRLWSGDVWKLIVCLKDYRPDLTVSTVDVPPTGLGIVRNLDPGSTALGDRFEALCRQYHDMSFAEIEPRKAIVLNRVPDDWDAVKNLLPDRPCRLDSSWRLRFRRSKRLPGLTMVPREVRRRIGMSPFGPVLRRSALRARTRLGSM
jgi:hypothetical protein